MGTSDSCSILNVKTPFLRCLRWTEASFECSLYLFCIWIKDLISEFNDIWGSILGWFMYEYSSAVCSFTRIHLRRWNGRIHYLEILKWFLLESRISRNRAQMLRRNKNNFGHLNLKLSVRTILKFKILGTRDFVVKNGCRCSHWSRFSALIDWIKGNCCFKDVNRSFWHRDKSLTTRLLVQNPGPAACALTNCALISW